MEPTLDVTETPPAPARVVPWRGRDLFYGMAAGLVLSTVLAVIVAIVSVSGGAGDASLSQYGQLGIAIYAGLVLATWYFAVKRRGGSMRDAGFRTVSGLTLVKMVPVTLGMMLLNGITIAISSRAFGDVPTAQDQVVGGAESLAFGDFLWLFALAAVVAPIAEEFLFRGLLYPLLRVKRAVVRAVFLSALAFALLHFIPPLIPAFLTMGVVFALVVEHYKSIYPAMLVHALNNGIVMLGLYATIGAG